MTLKEHIDDIRDRLKKEEFPNEAAVSQGIVLRLLNVLAWPTFDTQIVIPEYGMEGTRVDFALCYPQSKPLVFIEVKQVGNIEGAEKQLFQYAFHKGIPIAILTDGQKWRFFHPIGEGEYGDRKVCELNLSEGDSEETVKFLNRYLKYESIRTGEAVEAIKKDYEKVVQQRQVATRLPEAWSNLLEEADEFLLEVVAEKVESLCGYKSTDEQVLDFLKSLKIETEPDNGNRGKSTWNAGLLVTMPSKEKVNHSRSSDTFVEVIEKLGIEQVKHLDIVVGKIPLIADFDAPKRSQRKSGQYYIMLNTNTKQKKGILEEIALKLDESLEV